MADDSPAKDVRYRLTRDQKRVEIAPDLVLSTPLLIDVIDWEGYDLLLRLELVDGRYRCRELRVIQRDGGPEVTGETLRSVPVATFMRKSGAAAAYPKSLREMAKQGPTREVLDWVARVYRLAYAVGDAPKQQIAEKFGIAPSTAGRWIQRARRPEYGFLSPAEETGRAAI